MRYNFKVNDSTFYFAQNDRKIELFEHLYPTPRGMAYNNYLIKDEKTVLFDTVDREFSERLFGQQLSALDGAPLDYLVVHHMEPDHSGSIHLLRTLFPNVQIVGNKKTLAMLKGYHNITEGVIEVDEKTGLNIGSRTLQFVFAPMLHWPEVMFTYDPLEKTLFSADAFGCFGTMDGGYFDDEQDMGWVLPEARRYYSNIVGKYGSFTLKGLEKASQLEIKTICPLHGPVWRTHIADIIGLYQKWGAYEPEEKGVVIIYGSMYGNTDEVADFLARSIAAHGMKNVRMHHMAHSTASEVISDVFKYSGVVLASPTYNNELWPPMRYVLDTLVSRGIPNRKCAIIGSGTWNPNTMKPLAEYVEKLKWEQIGEPLKILMSMDEVTSEAVWNLGKQIADAIK